MVPKGQACVVEKHNGSLLGSNTDSLNARTAVKRQVLNSVSLSQIMVLTASTFKALSASPLTNQMSVSFFRVQE